MMPLASYLAFVAVSTALILLPGPNVALIVATSLSQGARMGLVTVAGTSSAMVMQLAATYFGLVVVLTSAARIFSVLRWAGVAYLLILGMRTLLAQPAPITRAPAAGSAQRAYLRGLAVSLTNPKTLLFYGAFLPQFLDDKGHAALQLLALSATFLAIAITFDSGWALLAGRLRGRLALQPRLHARLTGASLIGAALGLALAHEKS